MSDLATRTTSSPLWQRMLADAVRDPATLLEALELDRRLLPAAQSAARLFPLRVPWPYIRRMQRQDPHDPLLRQVLPLDAEHHDPPGYEADPVGDGNALQSGGVIHKYHGRALLIATGACAINCRYCFRRHFPYTEVNASTADWAGAIDYLAADTSIKEVILSGGDPLTLADRRLAALNSALTRLPHIQRLRVHSRLPVVLPQRVDEALLDWFTGTRLRPILVIHANHPAELDEEVAEAMARLQKAGVVTLNQAVLLRGINDREATQTALNERLFDIGVHPYYLHVLDSVRGASHFHVGDHEAATIQRGVSEQLPGYMMPRLVREIAGEPAKRWLHW
jgi:EF-P beta-lysylation protein EpmB